MISNRNPKRSTVRMRLWYKTRRKCKKFLVYAIICSNDQRFYAKVSFLTFQEYGLLDTGANISCIGGELAKLNFSNLPNFYKCHSEVKMADGQSQQVKGWISVEIKFKDKKREMNLFIIPSITQRLILGIWNAFQLIPNIVESAEISYSYV